MQSSFTYDTLNRVTALSNAAANYTYTLDGTVGNRTGVTEKLATSPSAQMVGWSYDGIYRLTNENISADPNAKAGSVTYGLDPVGNRLSLGLSQGANLPGISPIQSGSISYDPDDRLSTETYDANGNTLTSGGKTFAYDFENRLKSMNNGAVTIQYDADGNRIAKTVNGVTTRYLVDDLNPTGYAQVVEEVTAGAVTRTYTYGLQRIDENQPISNTWTPSFYGYDGGGTVRLLTESTGTVTDTYDYDAWGNAVNTTGSTPNVYLYRGEPNDSDLGFYYLRARFYNPLTGRFVSTDPQTAVLTDPSTLHRYLYANADPVNRIDPTGRASIIEYTLLIHLIGPLTWPRFAFPTVACLWDLGGGQAGGGEQAARMTGDAQTSCGCNNCKVRPVPPGSKGGPEVCAYYDDLCKSCGDKYGCRAGACCRSFGNSPKANCVRLCLLPADMRCLKYSCTDKGTPDPELLKKCRIRIHIHCYLKCDFRPLPWQFDFLKCVQTGIGN